VVKATSETSRRSGNRTSLTKRGGSYGDRMQRTRRLIKNSRGLNGLSNVGVVIFYPSARNEEPRMIRLDCNERRDLSSSHSAAGMFSPFGSFYAKRAGLSNPQACEKYASAVSWVQDGLQRAMLNVRDCDCGGQGNVALLEG